MTSGFWTFNSVWIVIMMIIIISGAILGSFQMEIGPFGDGDNENTTPTITERPVAIITKNRTNADVDELVSFNGSASFDNETNISSYLWDFDDGTTGDKNIMNHSWDLPGAYNVSLIVEDKEGNTNSTLTKIGITYREHQDGITNGETDTFDFNMVGQATKILVNTTLQNGDGNVGDNDVSIRISFEGSPMSEKHVQLSGDRTSIEVITIYYSNSTNLTEGNWVWELIVNESGLVCDIDWECEVVIMYAWN